MMNLNTERIFTTMVKPGIYEYYKGGYYKVLGVFASEETLEPYVAYESVEGGTRWIRPVRDFHQKVTHKGNETFRFLFIE